MLSSWVVIVAAGLLGAESAMVTGEAGLLIESGNRTRVAAGREAQTTGQLGVTPQLALEIDERSDLYRFTYSPRLFAQSPSAERRLDVLQRGSISARWNPARLWQVEGSAAGSYGLVDRLASVQPASLGSDPPVLQPVPGALVKEVSGDGQLLVEYRPAPRYRLQGRGGFSLSGGADAVAQQSIPLQYGPRLAAEIEWRPSPDDALVTRVTGSATRYLAMGLAGSSTEYTLDRFVRAAGLTETWRHTFDATVSAWIGGGVGFSHFEEVRRSSRHSFHPAAEAGLQWASPVPEAGWSAGLGSRLWAVPDALTGLVNERLDVDAALGWWLGRSWRIDGRGSGGVVVEKGGQYGDTVANGELRLTFLPQAELQVAGGLRILGQHQSQVSNQALIEWGAFLELTFATRQRL